MEIAQYILNQPTENLQRYAKENRELATKAKSLDLRGTSKEDLLRWADELEEIARGNRV